MYFCQSFSSHLHTCMLYRYWRWLGLVPLLAWWLEAGSHSSLVSPAGPYATDIDLEKQWGGPGGSFPSDRGVCRWAFAQEPMASMDQTQIELHCWNPGGVEHNLDAAWIVRMAKGSGACAWVESIPFYQGMSVFCMSSSIWLNRETI